MAATPSLPTHLSRQGRWSVSVQRIAGKAPEMSGSEIVLTCQEADSGLLVRRVDAFPYGFLKLNRTSSHRTLVEGRDAEWASAFTKDEIVGEIPASEIYELFGRTTARTLLTGHILALRLEPLLRMQEIEPTVSLSSQWEAQFRFLLSAPEMSLTTFTALNYKMLTDWLESSPSQVLAAVEKVSPTTIRNRLHSARTAGVIGKPGSGRRSTSN
jgi:hypothetical protein